MNAIDFPKTMRAAELRRILDERRSHLSSTDRQKIERALEGGRPFVLCAEFLPAKTDSDLYEYIRLERKSWLTVGLNRIDGPDHALVIADKAA